MEVEVAVLAVRRRSHLVVPWSQLLPVSGVPAALASEGLTINYNPSGSSDPSVATRTSGPGGGLEGRVVTKIGAIEGEAILGEAQEDHQPIVEVVTVAESAVAEAVQAVPATPEVAIVDESSRRIEDIPPEDIEPNGQSPEDPLPSSQVATLLRTELDSISQGEQMVSESLVAESVAEGHTEEVVMEEAPSQQEQVSVQEDVIMEDAPIEGEYFVAEDIQGESVVASGHTEVPSEDLPVQSEAAAAAQPNVPMEVVAEEEEEVSVEKGSETQGEGNENPPENQFREGETTSSLDSEDDDGDLQAPVDQAREKGKEVPLLANSPYQRSRKEVARPSGPSDQESGPSGPKCVPQAAAVESGPSGLEFVSQAAVVESGPSGPSDQGSGPSGPVESKQVLAEEATVALEPPAPSPTQTLAPSSPPSASTTPPAPQPFKQPQPRTISSPTPFPTHSSSPPVSHISPLPPLSEVPTASSTGASSSSATVRSSMIFL
ncbi:hypothetical protein Taro_045946 [Colocasia esculenta]|uniref:Uncharacterized protein n=1 Tax=Colocasia esculenta TaxID=4460 RepID=A0A843X5H6_COLES|nr:hypothetical protein [Colocasia esculenta]